MRRALAASLLIHAVALAWLPWTSAEKPTSPEIRFASATIDPTPTLDPPPPDPAEPVPEPLPHENMELPIPTFESDDPFPPLEQRFELPARVDVRADCKLPKRRPAPREPAAAPPPPAPSAPAIAPTSPSVIAKLQAPPRYPAIARRRAWQGTVLLELTISREGGVDAAKVRESSGYDVLDREALRVAREWRYRPGTRDGRPIVATLLQPVEFRLR